MYDEVGQTGHPSESWDPRVEYDEAGQTGHPSESWDPRNEPRRWIPACAGMTNLSVSQYPTSSERKLGSTKRTKTLDPGLRRDDEFECVAVPNVIPACTGKKVVEEVARNDVIPAQAGIQRLSNSKGL